MESSDSNNNDCCKINKYKRYTQNSCVELYSSIAVWECKRLPILNKLLVKVILAVMKQLKQLQRKPTKHSWGFQRPEECYQPAGYHYVRFVEGGKGIREDTHKWQEDGDNVGKTRLSREFVPSCSIFTSSSQNVVELFKSYVNLRSGRDAEGSRFHLTQGLLQNLIFL